MKASSEKMKNELIMNSVYVIWQDSDSRLWHPVAKLSFDNGIYRLNYTKGVLRSENFRPFPRMDDFKNIYESSDIFPFFANRLIQPTRPEFSKILNWLDTSPEEFNPLDFLGTTSGERETDNYRILQTPKKENSKYYFTFFISGIRYLPEASKLEIDRLNRGEELSFSFDESNQHDRSAIIIKTRTEGVVVGFCPKYLSRDFKTLIQHDHNMASRFLVKKVNLDAPSQYRLLCSFETDWPEGFMPFVSSDYLAYVK